MRVCLMWEKCDLAAKFIGISHFRYIGSMNTSNGRSTRYDVTNVSRYDLDKDKVVISVWSSKGSTRTGLCILNLSTFSLILDEYIDSQSYSRTIHMINIHKPYQVLIPRVLREERLGIVLGSSLPQIKPVRSAYLDANDCLNFLRLYSIDKLDCVYDDKKLAVTAGATCVNQVISSNKYHESFVKLRIRFETCESFMLIDTRTINQLELVENTLGTQGTSLYKVMNNCMTTMGRKLLKSNILQPLTDKTCIELRLQAVQELKLSNLLLEIRNLIKQFHDLDRLFNTLLVSNVISTEGRINNVLILKETIELTRQIPRLLSPFNSTIITQIKVICANPQIYNVGPLINEFINLDCEIAEGALNFKNQKAYAIKEGKNGLLDVSRQIYKSIYDNIISMTDALSFEYDINIAYHFDASRGFYFKIKSNSMDLPPVFIKKFKRKNVIECNTIELMKYNSRFTEISQEIIQLSDQSIGELYSILSEYASPLFMVSEAIGILDLLSCFAYNALNSGNVYIMPRLADQLRLKASRHVLLESVIRDKLVANDYTGEVDSSRLQLIVGSNMSGKSIYLRQICYVVIMAQIGSFVPAEYATLPLFKKLHTRIGSDNEDSTISLFSQEMTDMAYILNEANENNLIIVDELGRGSSLTDGFAISLAISEHLLKTKAMIFMSTHYHDLAQILANKRGVVVSHMQVDVNNDKLQMRYKISQGPQGILGYGIKYAENTGLLPGSMIEDAKLISGNLRNGNQNRQNILQDRLVESRKQKLEFDLFVALKAAKRAIGTKENEYLVKALKEMQVKYIDELSRI